MFASSVQIQTFRGCYGGCVNIIRMYVCVKKGWIMYYVKQMEFFKRRAWFNYVYVTSFKGLFSRFLL